MIKNKHQTLIFLSFLIFGLLVIILALISTQLGLGSGKDFLFEKLLGLRRKYIFLIGCVFVGVSFSMVPSKKIQLLFSDCWQKLSCNNISLATYFCLFVFVRALYFIAIGQKNYVTAWPRIQETPIILKLINQNILPYDFYTNYSVKSAKIVFAYIVYGITQLGASWEQAFHFLITLEAIFYLPIVFIAISQIFYAWKPTMVAKPLELQNFNILLLIGVMFIGAIVHYHVLGLGWRPVQHDNIFLGVIVLSSMFGFLYNYLCFAQHRFSYCSPILLFLSVLIHPTFGLCHFVVTTIFLLPLSFTRHTVKRLITHFAIGCCIPLMWFAVKDIGGVALDAQTFTDIYVYLRHPHHYDVLNFMRLLKVLGWMILFSITIGLSLYLRNSKLLFLSLLIALAFWGALIVQLLGNIIPIKAIVKIGPARFTSFGSLIWGINFLIVVSYLYKTKSVATWWLSSKNLVSHFYFKQLFAIAHIPLLILQWFVERKAWQIMVVVMLCVSTLLSFQLTYQHPLEYDDYKNQKRLIEWANKNTIEQDVFFIDRYLRDNTISHFIRIYANRSIFADATYPFSESGALEFGKRYKIFLASPQYQMKDYICLRKDNRIDYLVVKYSKQFSNYQPIFTVKDYANIYDLNAIDNSIDHQYCDIK
ncbi:MAG: hypothetical protein K0U45_09170 [Alphaproteobacteria bacterium]|nr:hypothetical protein [Alphaproteobacteria bacterium]